MSTILSDINKILEAINTDLEKIDLTNENDVEKISKMGADALEKTEEVVTRKDFVEKNLDGLIKKFKNASLNVEKYDADADIKNLKKDGKKYDEIDKIVKGKKDVKSKIKEKYDTLTMRKQVMDKYMEKYHPKYLLERQSDRIKANKGKMESNKKTITEIRDFQSNVSGDLHALKNNINLVKVLDELNKITVKIVEAENELKKPYDKDVLKDIEAGLKTNKDTLKEKLANLKDKYGVTINEETIEADINKARTEANDKINEAKSNIKGKINNPDISHSKDFNKIMNEKLTEAGNDNEKFVAIFDSAINKLQTENLNIGMENDTIRATRDELGAGIKIRARMEATKTLYSNYIITDEEIEEYIQKNNLVVKNPALMCTGKEKEDAIYNYLTGGKGGFHPIKRLRARYGKKAESEWIDKTGAEEKRKLAIEKIKEGRKAQENEENKKVEAVNEKQKSFREKLWVKVMGADSKEVEKWNEDFEKGQAGNLLNQVYNDMEK